MKNSFIWILLVIVIFVGFIGVAAWYKNGGGNSGDVPTLELNAKDHIRGNGSVTVIEYSDFQCPACRGFAPIVEQLIAKRGSDISFVYRHFPLMQHLNAYPAAQAAEAAGVQGKFYEMGIQLFAEQDKWATMSAREAFETYKKYATDLGLDVVKFEADYNNKDLKNRIKNDYKSGIANKVNSTPTFFVAGEKVNFEGANTTDDIIRVFETAIDNAKGLSNILNPLDTKTATSTPSL